MSNFKPTHRHIKTGNLYQKLGDIKFNFGDAWHHAIKYRNAIGDELAHTVYAFNLKFEELPEFNYPWDQAPDFAMFAATDKDGARIWYEKKPIKNYFNFFEAHEKSQLSYIDNIGSCKNWENSVQARPE